MKIRKDLLFFVLMVALATALTLFKPSGKTVYFYPGYFGFYEGQAGDVKMYGHNLSQICRDKGLKLKIVRHLDNLLDVKKIIVFEVVGYNPEILKSYPKEKLSLFLWEPPTILPNNYVKKNHDNFSKVFTWYDPFIDNKKYFKFYYPELGKIESDVKSFNEKKLCALISRNKSSGHPSELYSARIDVIRFFENNAFDDFDLYGIGWHKEWFKSYQGELPSKSILKNYKFSICYENAKDISGYVTEKIFNSFQYLCVPVYLGADNITDYVPKKCFIDRRDFKSNEELYTFLKNMTEEKYLEYQKNIIDFQNSLQSKKFSQEGFKKAFLDALK